MARGGRDRRIAQELQRLLPDLMRSELKDPRVTGLVTVTGVEVSRDLAHAKVYVTVMNAGDDPSPTVEALNRCSSFLRSRLSQEMSIRSVPALRFVFDASVERGARLTRLIDEAVARQESEKGEDRST